MQRRIHLIRHGQSEFNRLWAQHRVDPLIRDAPLSAFGLEQVAAARDTALALQPDVVITSPLTRAVQTAVGLFGGVHRIEVSALHRERVSNTDDVGSPASELRTRFPDLCFDHLDEVWWYDGAKDVLGVPVEPDGHFDSRVDAFLRDLRARPEPSIVVVGHGTFFGRILGFHPDNCQIMPFPL